jgi:iron(III) transport system permease protein
VNTRARTAAFLLAAAAVAGLVVVPLIRLMQVITENGGASVGRVLREPGVGRAATHSLLLACAVPLVAVPLGTAIALLLRRAVPGRGAVRLLVVLPLVIPQFVLGYSWTRAYGRAGFTDELLGIRWDGLEGPVGILVVLVVDAAPLCYLLTSLGLATRAQPDLERAARTSGAGGWTTLRTVTLPLLAPVLAAEVVLTFVATLESFAVPQVLGSPSGFATLTTRIYADLALGSTSAAFIDSVTLSLALVVVAAVLLVPADLVLAPRLRATRSSQGAGGAADRQYSRGTVAGVLALVAYSVLTVGLPSLALVAASVTKAIGLPARPSNWTLDNFRVALNSATVDALWNSVRLAALAAVLLTVLGVLVTVLERRRGAGLLGTTTTLAFAVPGSTLAVGLLVAYGRWFGAGLGLILLAYLAKFWAIAHRTISGAADRFPHGEWQAARVSGATPAQAARTIWLPAMAPALAGAWALVFVTALHEVTMSSLLYSYGNQTLAVAVLDSQQLGDVRTTAALCVLLTGVLLAALVPAWAAVRLAGRRRADGRAGRASLIARAEFVHA